ncbi:MAG: hypothetical protein K0S71_649 [Clostridia bacterium]|jgi:hypothetical protein|nr:hypothetical protein [Clostridia bacterium]
MKRDEELTLEQLVNSMVNGETEVANEYVFRCQEGVYVACYGKGVGAYTYKITDPRENMKVTDLSSYTYNEISIELAALTGSVRLQGKYIGNYYQN